MNLGLYQNKSVGWISGYRELFNIFILIGAEMLALTLSIWLSFQVRAVFLVDATIPQLTVAALPIWVLLAWLNGLYPGWGLGPIEDLRRVSRNVAVTFLLITGILYFTDTGPNWARLALLLSGLLAWVLMPLFRWIVRFVLSYLGWWGIDVAILGAATTGKKVIHALNHAKGLGFRPVSIYDDNSDLLGTQFLGIPVMGNSAEIAYTRFAAVFVAMPGIPRERLLELLRGPLANIERVYIVPDFFGMESHWVEARDLNGMLTLELQRNLLKPIAQVTKRLFDLVLVVLSIPLWIPLCLISALIIYLEDHKSPIYIQTRVGLDGQQIRVLKFRTMVPNADARLKDYLDTHPEAKLEWETKFKLLRDPRITKVGSFLRRSSLDEIPQLINILKGDMSLVGPRPLPQYHLDAMASNAQSVRAKVRPGLTGMWQVSGRSDTDVSGMVELDDQYVRNWSIWLDIIILARTIGVVLTGRGAY